MTVTLSTYFFTIDQTDPSYFQPHSPLLGVRRFRDSYIELFRPDVNASLAPLHLSGDFRKV
jgi:hypothetical protein